MKHMLKKNKDCSAQHEKKINKTTFMSWVVRPALRCIALVNINMTEVIFVLHKFYLQNVTHKRD